MAGYFNITLDTTGPSGVSVKINGDAVRTTSTAVTLDISCADSDTTGYQMKIWGDIDGALTESEAPWETFATTKNITLLETDNDVLTVYVRLRDDLWNTSDAASDTILLYMETPAVTIVSGPTPARITTFLGHNDLTGLDKVAVLTKSISSVTFTADKDISDIKVMVVESINALHGDASNVLIPTGGNSKIAMGTADDETVLNEEGGLTASGLDIAAGTEIAVGILGDDLKSASSADGVKLIKIFVREKDANWSI